MNDEQAGYPIPLSDLMTLWLDFGVRLHIASIGEDGVPAINADEAMRTACTAVAIGASDFMVAIFNTAFLDPVDASRQITRRAESFVASIGAARARSADQTAEVWAARFGLPETEPTATLRNRTSAVPGSKSS